MVQTELWFCFDFFVNKASKAFALSFLKNVYELINRFWVSLGSQIQCKFAAFKTFSLKCSDQMYIISKSRPVAHLKWLNTQNFKHF